MTPNQITLIRVLLAFLAVALFATARPGGWGGPWTNLAAVMFTAAAIVLDAVDGYVARRKKLATPLGAQLDILGDRVIENLFWTCFAVTGLISLWVPVIFFVRGTATDFLRSLAGCEGREGFGRNSLLETRWGRALVASRASRAAYGTLKCVCFCYLGLQLSLVSSSATGLTNLSRHAATIALFGKVLVFFTVCYCILRGLPVVWEGRRYLRQLAGGVGEPAGAAVR